jgi:hypothetical protein
MRQCILFCYICLISFPACEKKDENGKVYQDTKLLVAIKEDNRLVREYIYDSLNCLICINNYRADTIFASEYYKYDADHRMIKRSYGVFVETYAYDPDGKLKSTLLYYPANEKTWKVLYQYDGDRINQGTMFYNDTETGYIEFTYDVNGNTSERNEYHPQEVSSYYSQYRMEYDDKINPVKNPDQFPADMVMKNNTTHYYYYHAAMSTPPPEYNSTYDYDSAGYPVREYRESHTYDYEYLSRE